MTLLKLTLEYLKVNVHILSATMCRTPGTRIWPPEEAVIACGPRIKQKAWLYRLPIVVMGYEPLKAFGIYEDLTKCHGLSFWISETQRIIPTWHPAMVVSEPGKFIDFVEDLRNAFVHAIRRPEQEVTYAVVGQRSELHERLLFPIPEGATVTLDIETTGFDPYSDEILCVAVGIDEDHAVVIHERVLKDPKAAPLIRKFLQTRKFILHNGKFDVRFLRNHPVLQYGPEISEDTMLMHYTLDERLGTHGLKELAQHKLGLPDYEAELHATLRKKSDSYRYVPTAILHKYAARDVGYTWRLFHRLQQDVEESGVGDDLQRLYRFLIDAENGLVEIEENGLLVDQDRLAAIDKEFSNIQGGILEELREMVGDPHFNPNSPKQVAAYLFDELKLPSVRLFRNHKDRSTNREALTRLSEMFPDELFLTKMMEFRSLAKIVSTYITPVPDRISRDGRLRTDIKLHGTVTGRLASAEPNLMNLPRPTKNVYAGTIRNLFVAPQGWVLVGADYSQAEMRVLAELSKDPFLADVYHQGLDLHTQTTIMLFGEKFKKEDRMIAKMLNFGLVYGRTANSIAVERQMPLAEAQELMDRFFSRMPGVSKWLEEIRLEAVEKGYLKTPVGRYRRFGLITDKNAFEVSAQASNFPVSSTSSDICLTAFLGIHRWLKVTELGRALIMVHDSIIVECPEEHQGIVKRALEQQMIQAAKTILGPDSVPFAVDISVAKRWGEL